MSSNEGKIGPFDFVNDILYKKNNLFNEVSAKSYAPYVINKALASHKDCIFQVNEMNIRGHLPANMQHDFLFHIVRKYKRNFEKWISKEKDTNIQIIMDYYNTSPQKAQEILLIIDEAELKMIKEKMDKGGLDGKV